MKHRGADRRFTRHFRAASPTAPAPAPPDDKTEGRKAPSAHTVGICYRIMADPRRATWPCRIFASMRSHRARPSPGCCIRYVATTHQVDCAPPSHRGLAHVCKSSWLTHWRVLRAPAPYEYHSHLPADGWQSYGAGYGNWPAWSARLPALLSSPPFAGHFHGHDGDGWHRFSDRLRVARWGRHTAI